MLLTLHWISCTSYSCAETLCQSAWGQPLSHSDFVRGAAAATQPLSHSAALVSGWTTQSLRVAGWLSGSLTRVAEWLG